VTLFVAFAALLALGALAFVLPPLLRTRDPAASRREAANAAIYRAELAELAAERERGALADEEYARAVRELQSRIVTEAVQAEREARAGRRPVTAFAIAVLLPLAAALGYAWLGTPLALDPEVREAKMPSRDNLAGLVERLRERMQRQPEDADGWALLGRSLVALGDYERASQAFAEGVRRAPADASLLADYADALALARGRRLQGEPLALARRALELDPDHPKALALAGAGEYQAGNPAAAVRYWERLLSLIPADSDFARELRASLDEARRLAGAPTPGETASPKAVAAGALAGIVSLDPKLAGRVAPDDTVFVIARPAEGGRMPLAVARTTVAQLPYRFRLDDSMAMAGGAKLSAQAKVVVAARVSRSGNAMPQKGDIEGVSAPVAPGASDVRVVMARVIE
jgi:cytochrome c-type biogenesis protein CcmH